MDEPKVGLFAAMYLGAILGFISTIPALLIAYVAAGLGHGSEVPALMLFPYSFLLTGARGLPIGEPAVVLGLLQFPVYGLVMGCGLARLRRRSSIILAISVAAVHFLTAAACFAGIFPRFE